MVKRLKARYSRGVLKPLEPLELEEDTELTVMLPAGEAAFTPDGATTATAGAWASLVNCESFERNLYAKRVL